MSLPGSGDFENDLLTAMERDLKPLLEESADFLELDSDQIAEMETFLYEAWFAGTRTGHAQMRAQAIQRRLDVGPVGLKEVEADIKALLEKSADALNLTVELTLRMWDFLARAWAAGTKTCQAELMARVIETRSDVAEEALQWLEDEGDSAP